MKDYLTAHDVHLRGWSYRQIDQFLTPDKTGRSRFGKTVRRYHIDRVKAAEHSPEFIQSQAKLAPHRTAGKRTGGR